MTPGNQTTEFKLTLLAQIVGVLCEAAASILDTLSSSGHAAPWFPGALATVGVILQVSTLLGYQKSRTIVKTAALAGTSMTTEVTSPPK